jgi:uncharacterized protein (TIGR02679 family)
VTTSGSVEEARRRLESARYRPLWTMARARLERTGLGISNRPIRLDVTGEAREAIAGLVGLSPAGNDPLSLRLDRLDDSLRTGAAAIGLRELLERVDGPLVDRRAVRLERDASVSALWRSLAQHSALAAHPRLGEWLVELRSSGSAVRLVGSLDAVGPTVGRGLDVLDRLPVDQVPLAVFAADATGDAHALDRSTTLGSLVAKALAYLDVVPTGGEPDGDTPGGTSSWRGAWARVGVVCDELSASVLVLNLELAGPARGPVASAIAGHRRAGLPLRLTLQQLRSEPLRTPAGLVVHSCENPSVVALAAATLGARSRPLICTDGQPNGAVDELIRQLRGSGSVVAHHGDFDWGGIRIANTLMSRHHIEPWRFATSDYRAALDAGRVPLDDGPHPESASWDADLVPTMGSCGRCVFEEQVLSTLIEDLRR